MKSHNFDKTAKIFCMRIADTINLFKAKRIVRSDLVKFCYELQPKRQNFDNPLFYLQELLNPKTGKLAQKFQNISFFTFRNAL